MSTESNGSQRIAIEFTPRSRNGGSRYAVAAVYGEDTLHSDTFDLHSHHSRGRFVQAVARIATERDIPFNTAHACSMLMDEARNGSRQGNEEPETGSRDTAPATVLGEMGIEVLGEQEDQSVLCWVPATQKRWLIKSLQHWGGIDMTQALGEAAAERLWLNDGEPPVGMFTVAEVKRAVALAASRAPRIAWADLVGQGVWKQGRNFLVVNGAKAAIYNGHGFRQITHPVLGNRIIDFNRSKRWARGLVGRIREMNQEIAGQLLADLRTWLGQWNWSHPADATVTAGLVFSTFIQACWTWRPLVTITGESDSGKSTLLSELLLPILGDWTIAADRSTEAGLRQAMGHDACPVVIDEFDQYRHRAQVLELFRTSSRGGTVLRGTRDQEGRAYGVRHIAWFAAIESGELWGQDRNRRIRLELNRPTNRGMLTIPGASELSDFGQRAMAAALWAARAAIDLADRIKRTRIDGVHGRLIECFSVPAAMVAVLTAGLGVAEETAVNVLREMIAGREDLHAQGEADQVRLLRDILAANVRTTITTGDRQSSEERSVGQLLRGTGNGADARDPVQLLEAKGIKLIRTRRTQDAQQTAGGRRRADGERRLFLVLDTVQQELLVGTRWADGRIEQLLRRLPEATWEQQWCGNQRRYGVSLPWPRCLGGLDGRDDRQDDSTPGQEEG